MIDETTVARRVARIQGSLGVTLFNAVDGVRKQRDERDTQRGLLCAATSVSLEVCFAWTERMAGCFDLGDCLGCPCYGSGSVRNITGTRFRYDAVS